MADSRPNRRTFINLTSAALAALTGAPELAARAPSGPPARQTAAAGGQHPDLIVINAKVYTMDTRARPGRISAPGRSRR
jgi:hypothetical protein